MELSNLRYFLAVAEVESVNRAAERVPISPGSLTKAVQKLEAELGVKLFERVGRRIRLTPRGRELQLRARELLRLEEAARIEVGGPGQRVHLVLSGEEALLGSYAPGWMGELLDDHPGVDFELRSSLPEEVFPRLRRGEIDAGFTTLPVPSDLSGFRLGTVKFVTCVAPSHPLGDGPRRRRIAVRKLQEHGFVVPRHPILGAVEELQSEDGWRDDAFPRRVLVRADSLHQLISVVGSGLAVAYLPDYLAAELGLKVLTVTGCEYSCTQPVHLVVPRRGGAGWLRERLAERFS